MEIVLYLLILFTANVLGSLAGFGAGLLSLPFLTQMFDAKMIIVASSMTCILNVYIAIRWWRNINWRKLGIILLYMCIGLPFGVAFLKVMPILVIKVTLGLLMIVIGIYGLIKLHNQKVASFYFGKWLQRFFLFAGGVAQGAVSGGGSFVVLYAQQEIKDKQSFRATLALVWTTTSLAAVLQYAFVGMLPAESFRYALLGVPAVFAGIFAGGIISRKVSQKVFMYVVNILLIVAGAISCVSQLT